MHTRIEPQPALIGPSPCTGSALTHDRVVVGREGLWAAHGRLDARLFQLRQPVDSALDVAHKYVPVQLE